MPNKIVIVTGAGFSAPARLPIQNAILKVMLEPPKPTFTDPPSFKFLYAYIEVGICLLAQYTNFDTTVFKKSYESLKRRYVERNIVNNIFINLDSFSEIPKEILKNEYDNFFLDDSNYRSRLIVLKEEIRIKLEEKTQDIDINLEDVFTSFDKTLLSKEHAHYYTYSQMDNLRHSIMRLFIYYFGLKTKEHDFNNQDYLFLIKYLKQYSNNISIITTNWDTVFEKYMKNQNISYNHCLNNIYFKYDIASKNNKSKNKELKYIKIHGSINWCRCLSCGAISIVEKKEYSDFLFDDYVIETCEKCNEKNGAIQFQPEIITPTMMKSISSLLYNNLWEAAAAELSSANKIIFVGYSLPFADYEFRYLLKKNIQSDAKIDVVLHKNDDPAGTNKKTSDLLPSKRYNDLFSENQNKISFYYKGFGDYFEEQLFALTTT